MKYLNRLLVLAAVLLPMSVWAEDGTSMQLIENINLYYADDTLYLAQTTNMCEEGKSALLPKTTKLGAICLASEEIDKSNSKKTAFYLINNLLGTYWKKAANVDAAQHQASTVVLETDINFGDTLNVTSGTNAGEYDFSCKIKSTYGGLVFSGDAFIGNGKKIFNVCRAIDADKWGTSKGLFQEISNGTVKDLTLDSINFVVLQKVASGSVPNKEDSYKPVGALAGTIKNSSVSNITLEKINVSAPLAGGLAGYVESSTFKDIKTTTDGAIIVTNDIVLATNKKNGYMGTFKTVLGGLAGSSKFSTFENINLNLYLENSAKVDSSALGGVAGLYVYANENEDKPYWNKDIKITVPSTAGSVKVPVVDAAGTFNSSVVGVFSGATSLGGVFGETKRVAGNSSRNTRLYIENVEVTNLKATATNVAGSKPIGVYWGGVVGKSNLCLGGSLKISHAKATKLKFDIMQGVSGTYQNYWGGLVGYAGCSDNSGNYSDDNDLGLSLKNSKATGYMRLGGGGTAALKIYASSTLGGLVGEALLAVEENAVMLDSAEMNITYSAKNTVAATATAATQSVYAGGIIGAAKLIKNTGVISYWKGLIFKGYLDITDDGFNSYVGGIVGRFPLDDSENSRISFSDILVQTNALDSKLIAYSASGTATYASDAFLGGVCGDCNSISEIEKTAIVGNVLKNGGSGVTATLRKSYYVGGLVGRGTLGSFPITVKNTYSKGKITEFPIGLTTDPKTYTYIGYLFGSLSGNNGRASEFLSNYHYSENEEDVAAIANGDGAEYSTFDPAYSISVAKTNVRNCAAQNWSTDYNGCATSSYMKTQTFATLLNSVWSTQADKVWEYKTDLPTLGKTTYADPTTYTVTFKNGSEVVQEYTVEKGWPSPVPDVPAVDSKGCTFKEWQSDDDYSFVTKAITVNAVYGDCPVYTVTFKGLDGKTLKTVPNVTAGESVNAPAADDVPEYNGKCFTKWKNKYDLSYVTGDWTIEPESKTCVYEVTFFYTNTKGKRISQTQNVEYDKDAIPPSKSELLLETDDGVCFDGWDYEYTHVKGNLEVTELFAICKYAVVFNDLNGKPIEKVVAENGTLLPYPQIVEYGQSAVAPKDPEPVFDSDGNGRCFDKWSKNTDDYTNVTRKMDVSAYSKDCYLVTFYGLDGKAIVGAQTADGKSLDNPQIVDKNLAAIAPKDPESTADGICFDSWDVDYSKVTKGLAVKAKSKPCTYTVKFYDLRGFVIDGSVQEVLYGEAAVAPIDDPLQKDDLCFNGWDTDFSEVKGDLEVKPNTRKCVFTVNFYGLDGTTVIKTQNVQEGLSARAPTTPEPLGDLCFDGWDTDFSEVKGDLEVKANTKACPNSSSSDLQQSSSSSDVGSSSSSLQQSSSSSSEVESSSSVELSSSSDAESSSSVEQSSSSEVESSSSVEPSSSSSVAPKSSSGERYIATIMQTGNALTMTINDSIADKYTDIRYHFVVKTKTDTTYLDTIVKGDDVRDVKNGTWKLDPVPAGEYTVTFMLTYGGKTDTTKASFKGDTAKHVNLVSNTWQTYSLYAFCSKNKENCSSVVEEKLSRQHENLAIEECRYLKEELKQGNNDEESLKRMEKVCQEASGTQIAAYWWDESNPVGDYWQYRRYEAGVVDSTRGYWYGAYVDEPLDLSLQTPSKDDEIVWKLKNNYSGWNLVANPFGWFVNLPQEENIEFKKWNPDVSDYDTVSTLGPYEAIWVHTDKAREYRIPLKATIVLDGEKKVLSKSSTSENWKLRVELVDDKGKRDSWNELVAGHTASSLSEPPAGMGDRVNLSIVEGKQRLAKSVKKNSDELEWNLEARATTSRNGHLNFIGLESVWAKGLRVYATMDGETVEVTKDKTLDVSLSSKSKNVSVRVAKNAAVATVSKNVIKGFRVNQMSDALNVGFDAISKLAGAKVKVSIVGIDGRVVVTSGAVAKEGSNAISVKKPKQGVYFVCLKVGSLSATSRILVR